MPTPWWFGWQSTIALAQTSTPDTLVAVYFGWRGTIGLAQTGTPDSMVPFAGFAFCPPLFFSIWLVGHEHSLTAKRGAAPL